MEAQWEKPVVLSWSETDICEIASARAAVDCMMLWRWRQEKSYRKAVKFCLYALVGEAEPDKARRAFVAAARDASYLIRA